MTSSSWFLVLIAAVAVERLAELVVSTANARWSFAHGGVESGRRHYPAMVALHTGLLIACAVEAVAGHRPFLAWLGWPMLAVAFASQALRWWCIASLGRHWNTRVITVPGTRLVRTGPYRWLKHPNYAAVVLEGAALPLVHTAWITALAFTALNALLLRTRLRVENRALAAIDDPADVADPADLADRAGGSAVVTTDASGHGTTPVSDRSVSHPGEQQEDEPAERAEQRIELRTDHPAGRPFDSMA